MDIQQVAIIALIGTGAGLLSGLLGLGGAIVIIPALVILLGYSQQMAQGTALMMMVLPVGALAAFQYYQKGFVDIKSALIMAAFFFVSGYLGAKFAPQVPQEILKKAFAAMLIIIAVKMLFIDKH
ncbi:MAG: sulfite exporter TauE/SafE family protein [Chitinophagales bacterium]